MPAALLSLALGPLEAPKALAAAHFAANLVDLTEQAYLHKTMNTIRIPVNCCLHTLSPYFAM